MRPTSLALLFACACCAGIAGAREGGERPAAETSAAAASLHVEVDGGALTLQARGVALTDLLEAVARRGGLEIEGHGSLAGRITLELDSVPLPAALRRILRGHNFALRYADPASARTPELWVFPRRSPSRTDGAGRSSNGANHRLIEAYARLARRTPALADDDRKVRLSAVAELAAGRRETEAVAAAALLDGDAAVREEAVYGLGEIGAEIGVEILEQALADPARRVRRAAVEALADSGHEQSTWALAAALRDEDAALREQAVYALGDVGSDAAVAVLQQALADEQDFVREAATEVLEELSSED